MTADIQPLVPYECRDCGAQAAGTDESPLRFKDGLAVCVECGGRMTHPSPADRIDHRLCIEVDDGIGCPREIFNAVAHGERGEIAVAVAISLPAITQGLDRDEWSDIWMSYYGADGEDR